MSTPRLSRERVTVFFVKVLKTIELSIKLITIVLSSYELRLVIYQRAT